MSLVFNEDEFYSRNYEDPRKKSKFYNPFSIDTDVAGENQPLDSAGEFYTPFSQKAPAKAAPVSKTEEELVPMATPTPERKEEYGWWRKETDYTDWLSSQNLDPDKLNDFAGNKMFKDYIAWKAQNPEGLALLGKEVAAGLGSVIQSVSDTVASVPGLKTVVKPVGSVLQFIGNLFDAPRNVLAGAWAALSSGHPGEAAGNMWDALKFSISASIGNEGEDNKYFSWMDGQLRNLTDKARQGMSDKEYAKYIDSDGFRQTKRLWQVGGMVLDMVLDPAWLIGAGEVKALRAMKEINLGKQALNTLVKNISEIKHVASTLDAVSPFLKTEKAYVGIADRVNGFLRRSDKLIETIKQDDKFLKVMGIDADLLKTGKLSNLDTMELLLSKYKALGKGDLKGFEYAMRLKIPFVNRATGGMKIGPSMQPLIDVVKSKIGGYERGMLHVAGRIEERVKARAGGIHEVNELRYKAEKYLDKSLKEIAGGKDPVLAGLADEVMKSPDRYSDFLADMVTFDPDGIISASLKVPRDGKYVLENMYGAHLPLLRAVLNDTALKEVHTALKSMHSKTLTRASEEVAASERILKAFGVDAGMARKIREANPDDIPGMLSAATEIPKRDILGTKQPWEMTKEEFGDNFHVRGTGKHPSGASADPSHGLAAPASDIIETDITGWVGSTPWIYSMGPEGKLHIFSNNQIKDTRRGGWNLVNDLEKPILSIDRKFIERTNPHKYLVEQALREGKFVPPEVLKDYPGMISAATEMPKGDMVTLRTEVRAGQNYYKRTLDPRVKAYLGIGEEAERDVMKLGPAALASDPARVIYVPSDVGNKYLQEIVFSKPADLTGFRELARTDPEKAFMKMNTAIRELRRSDPEKFFELTQLSDQVIDGKLMKMNDLPFEQWSGKNPQYLIQQGSISGMNDLGRKGLIIEGYAGDIYKGGTMPLLEKIMNDERMIERLHSVTDIFQEGLYSDFIRKARTPQEIANLGAGWVPIKTGIFRGFAVQDFLEKPLQNAMKGVFGVVEAEMPHNWFVGHTLKAIETFNNWWKVNIYLKNPAAQARNFLTNRLMMMGDHISFMNIFSREGRDARKVSRYMGAIRDYQSAIVSKNEGLMAKFKTRFTELGKETAILDGRKIAVNELAEEMMRLNVSSHGLIGDIADQARKSLPNAAGEAAKEGNFITKTLGHKYNILGKNDLWAIKMGDVAQAVEQGLGRNEYFLTLVNQKGWSVEKAAARVNEIMIDYGRISRTEGALRKYAIPFYTWQSRMIPNMLIKAIEQPVYFTKFTQFKNNMYNILELDKNFAPFGETTSEGVPWIASADIGKFISGRPLSEIQTQYLSGEGWMPQAVLNLFKFDGLSRLLRPIAKDMNFFEGALGNVIGATTSLMGNVAKGALEYGVSGMTPTVKLPVESFSNYSFQFQRPLETYPDQTIRYIGMNLKPIQVNLLKSLWGGFREINDLASVFDKRTSSGEAKYTWADYLLKHLGAKPYERNEVREVNSVLWKMRELYQSNLSDAKHAQNNPKAQESHAMKALMAYHAIDTLEWYKTFILEMRDKRAFILGIQQDIGDIETKMQDEDISRKRRAALSTQRYDLLQKLNQLNGDIERL